MHRPGVLIVDDQRIAVVDLDAGELHDVAPDLRSIFARAELDPVPGDLPPAVPAVARRPGQPVGDDAIVCVDGPLALRLDDGRVLAWDLVLRSHVALDDAHLAVLDLARTPQAVAIAVDGDPIRQQAVADLAALGLLAVTPGPSARPDDEPEPAADEVEEPAAEVEEPPSSLAPSPADAAGSARIAALGALARRAARRAERLGRRAARKAARELARRRGTADPSPALADPAPVADLEAADPEPEPEPVDELVEVVAEPAVVGEVEEPPAPEAPAGAPIAPFGADGRVPVIPLYCWGWVSDDQGFGEKVEPSLSVGMLFATARAHDGGRLEERYDLRRLRADAEAVFDAWAAAPVPAIFVFSDYLWNLTPHLDLSRRVKELSPESICLHGGPSVPKYEDDAVRFFAEHPSVDVAARGEGEVTFVELLDAIGGDLGAGWQERVRSIAGITVRVPTAAGDELVRTDDRPRLDDLDQLPSPYLTGEFDDMLDVEWRSASVETNRGCPYGCTYCDWGSATLARIRKFDLDRVLAELDWIARRAAPSEMHVTDANFGIFARDVDIAERVVELKERHGAPYALTISLAKNTVKYSQRIISLLTRGGVSPITASSAVQTLDPHTLEVVRRQNIRIDKYDELAVTFQEEGIPLVTDLLMGLPGATVESFRNDLQHCFDREVTPRTMEIIMLPNAPMNEPAYREEHQIVVDEHDVVVGSSSFSREDYEQMRRLRLLYRGADHFGVLRQVLRFLQWDRRIPALDVVLAIDEAVSERGNRYPLLAFFARTFDLYTIPAVAWDPFFDEVVELLDERFDVALDDELATVIAAQKFVLPHRGRAFPDTVELAHDWVAYVENHRASERGTAIHQRLARFGPGTLEVTDPNRICALFTKRNDFPGRRSATTGNLFWVGYDWELLSPLARRLATNLVGFREALA